MDFLIAISRGLKISLKDSEWEKLVLMIELSKSMIFWTVSWVGKMNAVVLLNNISSEGGSELVYSIIMFEFSSLESLFEGLLELWDSCEI